jgi:hypothetical protein
MLCRSLRAPARVARALEAWVALLAVAVALMSVSPEAAQAAGPRVAGSSIDTQLRAPGPGEIALEAVAFRIRLGRTLPPLDPARLGVSWLKTGGPHSYALLAGEVRGRVTGHLATYVVLVEALQPLGERRQVAANAVSPGVEVAPSTTGTISAAGSAEQLVIGDQSDNRFGAAVTSCPDACKFVEYLAKDGVSTDRAGSVTPALIYQDPALRLSGGRLRQVWRSAWRTGTSADGSGTAVLAIEQATGHSFIVPAQIGLDCTQTPAPGTLTFAGTLYPPIAGVEIYGQAEIGSDSTDVTALTTPSGNFSTTIAVGTGGGYTLSASTGTDPGFASIGQSCTELVAGPATTPAPVATPPWAGSPPVATALAPSVTAVSPASGTTAGGTRVTITGTDFTNASEVEFGTTPATSFTVLSPTEIAATTPPAPAGTLPVTVTVGDAVSPTSSTDRYTYVPPPTVTVVSPDSGPSDGGTSVTIAGTGLSSASAVQFGTGAATSFSVDDSGTQITAESPPGDGTVDITVTTPGGTSKTTSADQFTYTPSATTLVADCPDTAPFSPNGFVVGGALFVSPDGPGISGATVVVTYALLGGSSSSSISTTTEDGENNEGSWTVLLQPPTAGTYVISATYAGGGDGSATQSTPCETDYGP